MTSSYFLLFLLFLCKLNSTASLACLKLKFVYKGSEALDYIHYLITEEGIHQLMDQMGWLGFIIAVLLPLIEAFLPILPIIVFAVVNVNAYGLLLGFFLTWLGSVLGAYAVFVIFRTYGQSRFLRNLQKHPHITKFMVQVERGGIIPLFILLCFPFTPSFLINIVAAMSSITKRAYLWTVMVSKGIMLFTLSFIGTDLKSFITNPKKSIIILLFLFLLWWIGKRVEHYYREKVEDSS